METAWRLGRRNTAIATFHRMHQALEEDLGVEPSEKTVALYLRICDTDSRRESSEVQRRTPLFVAAGARVHRPAGHR